MRMSDEELGRALSAHFGGVPPAEPPEALLEAVRAEARAGRDHAGALEFVLSQVGRVRPGTWLAALATLALPAVSSAAGAGGEGVLAAAAVSGALAAAAVLPEIVSGRSCGMWELESACLRNASSVAFARLAITGSAAAAALLVGALLCSAATPAWVVLAHSLAPFLVAAAGGLGVARRARSADALWASIAWTGGVLAASLSARSLAPAAYSVAAAGVWALAAAAAALSQRAASQPTLLPAGS